MNLPTALNLSIIIPCYNEAPGLKGLIPEILKLELPSSEIIVVDDGSTDGSPDVVKSFSPEANIRVVQHPYNIGNGAAIKSGIRASTGKLVAILDADGQHNPQDLTKLIHEAARYHMVVGARTYDSQANLHRSLANRAYNWFASFICQFEIEDLTSGFRVIRRKDAVRFCDMLPNGFSSPTTITLAFIRSGRSVKYIPIAARQREGKSKIKLFRDGFEFFIIIMKITMAFSPLRVFMPIASFLFFLGLGRYLYTYLTAGQFTNMSHLLINSAIIIFMLGMIAEQIASLRFERGDHVEDLSDE